MTQLLIGIDVGTSGVKVVATDLSGRLVADASQRYATATSGTAAEQDPMDWWDAVCSVTRQVVAGREVAAVSVTSQAPTLVPVDAAGHPTCRALTWLDRRADAEAERIALLVPHSRNGADPYFGTAKLPWLASHRAEALARSEHVLSANGFIVRRLSGVSVLDDTTAALMQGFDDATSQFDADLVAAEPSLRYLPPVVPSTKVVGSVTSEAAASTGIPAGTPVVAGGIDSIGSLLEAGVMQIGDPLVDMTGFSSVTIMTVPRGTHVPGFIHTRHCVPNVDLLITAQVTAGAVIDWVNGLDSTADLRDSAAILGRQRPSRLTMVTSLAGERTPTWNRSSRGTIDGIDLSTDATEIMLAAMEGNAHALARDIALIREAGYPVDRMLATGGGSSSRAWLQIKADVLGVPVDRPASGHGAAQGAAILAGLAIGAIDQGTVSQLGESIESRFEPNLQQTAAYAARSDWHARIADLNLHR